MLDGDLRSMWDITTITNRIKNLVVKIEKSGHAKLSKKSRIDCSLDITV